MAYRDGQLALVPSETMHAHLATCSACARMFGELGTCDRRSPPEESHPRDGATLTGEVGKDPSWQGHGIQPTPPTTPPTDTPAPSMPKLVGYYQILDRLGKGGMGDVFRARHVRLKREVAFKVLPLARMASPAAVARFMREVEAVGRLEHPNIVRALDAGEVEGVHYLVMEIVKGIDLARLAAQSGPLPLAEACELIRQAAVGLQYANENEVVHRDVKPSNLMLTLTGQVKILDLGLALLRCESGKEELTASGLLMGTADYMAPEQWYDAHTVDIRADIYSLGCTLYRLLTGTPPFGGPHYESLGKKMEAHARVPVAPLRDYCPDIPVGFVAVLEMLLAKSPADRFQTPQEVVDALAPFAASADLPGLMVRLQIGGSSGGSSNAKLLPVPAPPSRGISTMIPPPVRRGRRIAALLFTLAVVGVGAGVWRFFPAPPVVETPLVENPGCEPAFAFKGWSALLEREPERLWPRDIPRNFFSLWDKKQQSLRVDSPATSLFALGEVRKLSYRFQVGIGQIPWEGRVGVFLGYRPWQGPNGATHRCQFIELRKAQDRPSFSLERAVLTVHQGAPPARPDLARSGVSRSLVPHPVEQQEYILEVEVRDGQVRTVTWNGQVLPELVKAEYDMRLLGGDYAGAFGVYCARGHGFFHNARIMVLSEE